jgi:hypothetical protein
VQDGSYLTKAHARIEEFAMVVMLLLLLITLTSGVVLGVLGVTALAICSEDKSVRRIQVGVRRLCGARIPSSEEVRRR